LQLAAAKCAWRNRGSTASVHGRWSMVSRWRPCQCTKCKNMERWQSSRYITSAIT
jgi:hypothetical protein